MFEVTAARHRNPTRERGYNGARHIQESPARSPGLRQRPTAQFRRRGALSLG